MNLAGGLRRLFVVCVVIYDVPVVLVVLFVNSSLMLWQRLSLLAGIGVGLPLLAWFALEMLIWAGRGFRRA